MDIKPVPVAIYNNNKLNAKTVVTIATAKKSLQFTIPKQVFMDIFLLLITA
jgi:hypothetical protein